MATAKQTALINRIAYDPVAARLTGLELTDERGAESFNRTDWRPGDVALGDRCYARPPALRRMLTAGADFIVRTGWTRLRLLDVNGAPVAWERVFGDLAVGEVAERAVSVDYSGKRPRSQRKSPEKPMCSQVRGEVWASKASGTASPPERRCATASAM